jgi:hypothetical protein
VNAYSAPTMHLRRIEGGSMFETYTKSFDVVWATSEPAAAEQAA